MGQVNILMCAGFSPSARVVRKAIRRVAEQKEIRVLSPCPAGAGLAKYVEELKSLDPSRTLVVEGCDGCCGTQTMMLNGVMPTRTVIIDKTAIADERAIASAEAKILASLKEMGE
ncbi:MAG: putative zinc-binding protein [Methanomassiliicoccus sp.]|nr:putative zinc-binding protein [Methanomassiliicoccus sp.]